MIADVDGDFKAEIVSALPRTPPIRRSAAIPRKPAFWRGARDHTGPPGATRDLRFGKTWANARIARAQGPDQRRPNGHDLMGVFLEGVRATDGPCCRLPAPATGLQIFRSAW